MKSHLTFLFVLIVQACLAQTNILYFDADWKSANQQNAVYYSVVKPVGDKFSRTDYFAKNKQLQMSGTYTTTKLDVKDGYFKWYYQNGKLKEVGSYKNNLEEGEHVYYGENGIITSRVNFVDGELLGPLTLYFGSGNYRLRCCIKKVKNISTLPITARMAQSNRKVT